MRPRIVATAFLLIGSLFTASFAGPATGGPTVSRDLKEAPV